MIRESVRKVTPGIPMIGVFLVAAVVVVWRMTQAIRAVDAAQKTTGDVATALMVVMFAWIIAAVLLGIGSKGFFMVQPNTARALTLFGDYKGTVKTQGLWWSNPFFQRPAISLRVRNFETGKLKVNDHAGNPIEIGAVVVWQVVDTAEALFEVDNYDDYVHVQSESALRGLANQYPYDAHENEEMALVSHTVEIAERLKGEIQDRLSKAGVKVLEARISHLAYAQEIASAMLRRQQANAIIAARQRIVEGAVGMVESALQQLAEKKVVVLDDERRAAMVSNLLVVLCAEQATQPVVNAGTLY